MARLLQVLLSLFLGGQQRQTDNIIAQLVDALTPDYDNAMQQRSSQGQSGGQNQSLDLDDLLGNLSPVLTGLLQGLDSNSLQQVSNRVNQVQTGTGRGARRIQASPDMLKLVKKAVDDELNKPRQK